MTDLELVDEYIVKCSRFVNPTLLREVTNRGLYNIINYLPKDINEAKVIARGRMAKIGKYFEDEEINEIANKIQRAEYLRNELNKLRMSEADEIASIINEMLELNTFILDYYK